MLHGVIQVRELPPELGRSVLFFLHLLNLCLHICRLNRDSHCRVVGQCHLLQEDFSECNSDQPLQGSVGARTTAVDDIRMNMIHAIDNADGGFVFMTAQRCAFTTISFTRSGECIPAQHPEVVACRTEAHLSATVSSPLPPSQRHRSGLQAVWTGQ
jgi:hypothetical protein